LQLPALLDLIVEENFPDPPVFAAGAQPETVPTEVMYPFFGVFVTGGWKVDVPFRTLQLLVAAAAGDAVNTTAVLAAASESAQAAEANFEAVLIGSSLGETTESVLSVVTRE
jgi:hypothetical protein